MNSQLEPAKSRKDGDAVGTVAQVLTDVSRLIHVARSNGPAELKAELVRRKIAIPKFDPKTGAFFTDTDVAAAGLQNWVNKNGVADDSIAYNVRKACTEFQVAKARPIVTMWSELPMAVDKIW